MNDEIRQLLLESANLLVVGMGVVFVFLGLLIGVVKLMSSVVQKFPEPESPQPYADDNTTTSSTSISPEVVAAITAAIHQYRQKK